jgi:2-phosphosulfolactate phosphatase
MNIDVVSLPSLLSPAHLRDRTVVVLDVLRATTTMTAALAARVAKIIVLPDIPSVLREANAFGPPAISCGEVDCLPPAGFTTGNSPGSFDSAMAGRTVFMATTNGTRAIIAAADAPQVLIGAIVNASAVAKRLQKAARPATLLCSGTNGQLSMEDLIGAGSIIEAAERLGPIELASDTARLAHQVFRSVRHDLPGALRTTQGGMNLLRNHLAADIDFAARLDGFDIVGIVSNQPLHVSL